eukprot:gene12574-2296_t
MGKLDVYQHSCSKRAQVIEEMEPSFSPIASFTFVFPEYGCEKICFFTAVDALQGESHGDMRAIQLAGFKIVTSMQVLCTDQEVDDDGVSEQWLAWPPALQSGPDEPDPPCLYEFGESLPSQLAAGDKFTLQLWGDVYTIFVDDQLAGATSYSGELLGDPDHGNHEAAVTLEQVGSVVPPGVSGMIPRVMRWVVPDKPSGGNADEKQKQSKRTRSCKGTKKTSDGEDEGQSHHHATYED